MPLFFRHPKHWWELFPVPANLKKKPGVYGQAVGWILLSCVLFTALQVELRKLMEHTHPFQAAFLRNLAAWLFVLPLALPQYKIIWRAEKSTHLWRAVVGVGGMLSMFISFHVLPFAQAVSLSFLAPLFATIGAALFLKETVKARRWTAIALGMAGMLVMLRPWRYGLSVGMLAALVSAVFVAVSTLLVKHLAGRDTLLTNLFYMGLLMVPMTYLTAQPYWQPLPHTAYSLVLLIGLTATLAQTCLYKGFALADASALLPFDFVRLPLAVLCGRLFFGETMDAWSWAGALIIVFSSTYVMWREARQKKRGGVSAMCLDGEVRS
jgi:drug/metabolite transporter (DMT)-like permease